ncbi:MAG: fumarylacetoacetate hydrolase family protein [Porticoccaceae bacterium]|jgi:2-keto-4-pentenoate hydratase/2-oxohepta-3-ene-1,7-dioic acid hydratase in catechol pathway|nr:fumarylacetoacetate hydrolase family protein [Porticoccaceae bacterium]MEA3299840.1 fumarylacetoacetate hydrolase family protein [Pseudomonadota bacterium]HLS98263.1 fumarylacetoacetate hydrolase family protein [Porticoccaceae bacterium]
MRFLSFKQDGKEGLAVAKDGGFVGLTEADAGYPGNLDTLVPQGTAALARAGEALAKGRAVDLDKVEVLPPLSRPPKIFCLGLNYKDHAKEAGLELPDYPTIFTRFATSLIGHNANIVRPRISHQLDYEGELTVVLAKGGRHIPVAEALDHVAGYSVFNDGSIRDYQIRTSQWTVGKTFDGTGAFGPTLVTPDEVPPGASGLKIETRLNGQVVQRSNTDQLIFDVATVISLMSQAITLEAGDVFIMGTPSGVGHFHKPPLYMKPGDICEVEIEGLGLLRNGIEDEQ